MALSKILLIALGLLGASVNAQSAAITYYGSDEDGNAFGNHDNRLIKYLSVAIPTNFPNLRTNDWVTIPIFKGKILPGTSTPHNGCFRVDDTCPTSLCRNNGQHFDVFVGNYAKNVRGMEQILDSTRWTAWSKGCTRSAMVSAIVNNYADSIIDDDEDNFFEDDQEDYFVEEAEFAEPRAKIVRPHHKINHRDDDYLN